MNKPMYMKMFGRYIPAILLLTILALATCCSQPSKQGAANDATSAKTSIAFLEKEHDFGEYREKETKRYAFKYKNAGKSPLVIYKAESDCGCTQVKFNPQPLMPGEYDSIIVVYDGNGFLNGSFRKFINIYSNASEKPMELSIKGSYFDKSEE